MIGIFLAGSVDRNLEVDFCFFRISWKHEMRRRQDRCVQITKGVWGMSWHQKTKKGAENCDKPGGVVKQALIPGFLNKLTLNT